MRLPALVAVAAVLLVAGCGTRPDDQPTSAASARPAQPAAFNATDVMFLQMMVPHHAQGIEIVKLGATRASRPEVRELTTAIEVTQRDEIGQMSGWLTAWRQPATAAPEAHAAHGGLPGTTDAEIAAVRDSRGRAFDRAFLNLLLAHQRDAVKMADAEISGGVNLHAKAFAERVVASRSGQIKQMVDWLRSR
jgi:uncharacterized protein (DUF305 family)